MTMMVRGADGRLYSVVEMVAVVGNDCGVREQRPMIQTNAGAEDSIAGNYEFMPG